MLAFDAVLNETASMRTARGRHTVIVMHGEAGVFVTTLILLPEVQHMAQSTLRRCLAQVRRRQGAAGAAAGAADVSGASALVTS